MNDVEAIRNRRAAAVLIAHPLRARILAEAREPVSGAALARRLAQPRQRVGYHVRQLAQAGLLQPVGQQKRRNMIEQQFVASARSYVLAPSILGEVAPHAAAGQDLLAVCAQAQSEVAQVMEAAQSAGLRARTLGLRAELRFTTVEQRAAFTEELQAAIAAVIERHASAGGRAFHFIAGLYPAPELR